MVQRVVLSKMVCRQEVRAKEREADLGSVDDGQGGRQMQWWYNTLTPY
jgi:hypothetical protein